MGKRRRRETLSAAVSVRLPGQKHPWRIRLTEGERRRLEEGARERGLTLSAFVRERLDTGTVTVRPAQVIPEVDPRHTAELRELGRRLNEFAKEGNIRGEVADVAGLKECFGDLRAFLDRMHEDLREKMERGPGGG